MPSVDQPEDHCPIREHAATCRCHLHEEVRWPEDPVRAAAKACCIDVARSRNLDLTWNHEAAEEIIERHMRVLQTQGGRIVTPCPACGRSTLFIGTGGHLTCGWIGGRDSSSGPDLKGCPEPTVARSVDALRAEVERQRAEAEALRERIGRLEETAAATARGDVPAYDDEPALPQAEVEAVEKALHSEMEAKYALIAEAENLGAEVEAARAEVEEAHKQAEYALLEEQRERQRAEKAEAEVVALRGLLGRMREALDSTNKHLLGGIQETQADYQSPPEPATQWDYEASIHYTANLAMVSEADAALKEQP